MPLKTYLITYLKFSYENRLLFIGNVQCEVVSILSPIALISNRRQRKKSCCQIYLATEIDCLCVSPIIIPLISICKCPWFKINDIITYIQWYPGQSFNSQVPPNFKLLHFAYQGSAKPIKLHSDIKRNHNYTDLLGKYEIRIL